jgi:hypothetical protein
VKDAGFLSCSQYDRNDLDWRDGAHGPTEVRGTEETAVFRIGTRLVRQVRYDRETLVYSFVLANDGRLPVTVTELARADVAPRLFDYQRVTDENGDAGFTLGAGERRRIEVSMLMTACETLSARAGSFATEVGLHTRSAGVLRDVVRVAFPEEVHTGSPREAVCPGATTATSRPPG